MQALLLLSFVVCLLCIQTIAFQSVITKKYSNNMLNMLVVGDIAPDFELKNYNGKAFKLSALKGKKPVVVFFYPADSTPGCTAEVYT